MVCVTFNYCTGNIFFSVMIVSMSPSWKRHLLSIGDCYTIMQHVQRIKGTRVNLALCRTCSVTKQNNSPYSIQVSLTYFMK